jgi:hypothetical protein
MQHDYTARSLAKELVDFLEKRGDFPDVPAEFKNAVSTKGFKKAYYYDGETQVSAPRLILRRSRNKGLWRVDVIHGEADDFPGAFFRDETTARTVFNDAVSEYPLIG